MTAVDKSLSVEFVPVNDYGTAPRVPASTILLAMGVKQEDVDLSDRDKPVVWEGYVPESCRGGDTAKDDPELGKLKVAALALADNLRDDSVLAGSVDPRDNDNAPDTREKKRVAHSDK